jgi:hypothetical protein
MFGKPLFVATGTIPLSPIRIDDERVSRRDLKTSTLAGQRSGTVAPDTGTYQGRKRSCLRMRQTRVRRSNRQKL